MPDFRPSSLQSFVQSVCAGLGSFEKEQQLVADQLINANLAGHDSHGIGMLPKYVENAISGNLRINVEPEVVTDSGPLLVMDGLAGFGQVNGYRAMEAGIAKAREYGVALVGLRNSFHIGRIGHWGEQAAAAGMASIHFVNVSAHQPLVAPYGGYEARFGTNPVCIAIPGDGDRPAALLDMATSIIALGKARVAMNKGESVPAGTLLDTSGSFTTDPTAMFPAEGGEMGALVAAGEYKGSGLAFMCEVLGAALIGGSTISPHHPRSSAIINSMLTIVIDPDRLGTRATLYDEAKLFMEYYQNSAPRPDVDGVLGIDGVLVPGEPELLSRAARAEQIPVDDTTVEELNNAAMAAGVPSLT